MSCVERHYKVTHLLVLETPYNLRTPGHGEVNANAMVPNQIYTHLQSQPSLKCVTSWRYRDIFYLEM
jgi:hypothetical protein